MDVQDIRAITEAVRGEVGKAVVGQDAVIDLLLTSLLVGGHVLLDIGAVATDARGRKRPPVDVGRENLDLRGGVQRRHMFAQQDADRIGLFAGRTA